MWTCECFLRSEELANRRSQPSCSHLNGFSPGMDNKRVNRLIPDTLLLGRIEGRWRGNFEISHTVRTQLSCFAVGPDARWIFMVSPRGLERRRWFRSDQRSIAKPTRQSSFSSSSSFYDDLINLSVGSGTLGFKCVIGCEPIREWTHLVNKSLLVGGRSREWTRSGE